MTNAAPANEINGPQFDLRRAISGALTPKDMVYFLMKRLRGDDGKLESVLIPLSDDILELSKTLYTESTVIGKHSIDMEAIELANNLLHTILRTFPANDARHKAALTLWHENFNVLLDHPDIALDTHYKYLSTIAEQESKTSVAAEEIARELYNDVSLANFSTEDDAFNGKDFTFEHLLILQLNEVFRKNYNLGNAADKEDLENAFDAADDIYVSAAIGSVLEKFFKDIRDDLDTRLENMRQEAEEPDPEVVAREKIAAALESRDLSDAHAAVDYISNHYAKTDEFCVDEGDVIALLQVAHILGMWDEVKDKANAEFAARLAAIHADDVDWEKDGKKAPWQNADAVYATWKEHLFALARQDHDGAQDAAQEAYDMAAYNSNFESFADRAMDEIDAKSYHGVESFAAAKAQVAAMEAKDGEEAAAEPDGDQAHAGATALSAVHGGAKPLAAERS